MVQYITCIVRKIIRLLYLNVYKARHTHQMVLKHFTKLNMEKNHYILEIFLVVI